MRIPTIPLWDKHPGFAEGAKGIALASTLVLGGIGVAGCSGTLAPCRVFCAGDGGSPSAPTGTRVPSQVPSRTGGNANALKTSERDLLNELGTAPKGAGYLALQAYPYAKDNLGTEYRAYDSGKGDADIVCIKGVVEEGGDWTYTVSKQVIGGGCVPIQWGDTPHSQFKATAGQVYEALHTGQH